MDKPTNTKKSKGRNALIFIGGTLVLLYILGSMGAKPGAAPDAAPALEPAATSAPAELPLAERSALSADAADIRDYVAVRDALAETELAATDKMESVVAIYAEAKKYARDDESRRDALARIAQALKEADELLAAGLGTTAPKLNNQDAQRHINSAVDAHHQWIMSQRAKIGASMKFDLAATKRAGAAADNFAMNEATALVMTERSLGMTK